MGAKLDVMFFCLCAILAMSLTSSNASAIMLLDDVFPAFRDVGNHFADALYSPENISMQLVITVQVFDEDGVAAVIGSYKEDSAFAWNNLTLEHWYTTSDGWDHYIGYGPTFNLTVNNPTRVWNVKFHANDTAGNWNVSNQANYSYNMLPQASSPIPIFAVVGGVIIVAELTIIFALIVWKRPRTSFPAVR